MLQMILVGTLGSYNLTCKITVNAWSQCATWNPYFFTNEIIDQLVFLWPIKCKLQGYTICFNWPSNFCHCFISSSLFKIMVNWVRLHFFTFTLSILPYLVLSSSCSTLTEWLLLDFCYGLLGSSSFVLNSSAHIHHGHSNTQCPQHNDTPHTHILYVHIFFYDNETRKKMRHYFLIFLF